MKNKPFRASASLLVLALLAACGGADGTADFTAAADALEAKLKAGAPAAADPAVKAFQDQTAKGLEILGTPALPLRGFDSYEQLCGKTATIVGAYVNLGVDKAPEAEKIALMNRNAEQYLDQMFTPLLFSAHCSARHMPFLEKQVGGDVAGKAAALQQVRGGAQGQMAGLLQMAGDASLDAPRRRRVVDLLAADAKDFAIVFSPAQRQELAGTVDQVRATLEVEAKPAADRIKAGLAEAPCGALCKM